MKDGRPGWRAPVGGPAGLTNVGLAVFLAVALVTGVVAQAAGTTWGRVPLVLHGIAGLGIVFLVRPKSRIATRGWKRNPSGRLLSTGLTAAVAVTVATGVLQTSGLVPRLGPLLTMQVHVGAGVAAGVLAAGHYRLRPSRPRRTDLDRRALLKAGSVAAAAGVVWLGAEAAARLAGWPASERRFTGSHERGSGNPAAMPVTQWLDDRVPSVDVAAYRLEVPGRAWDLDDLAALPIETVTATLDCTSGWYATQEWRGIRLDRLVDPAGAASVKVISATGYSRRFPPGDLSRLWLATGMAGAPLSAGHGSPLRLVAPGRRGFWWVKWVTKIERSAVPWWVQLPFPLS